MGCSCQRYVYLSKQYDFVWWIIIYFMLCTYTLNNAPSMRLLLLVMRLRSRVDKDFILYLWMV
jgi:hypothetical protein